MTAIDLLEVHDGGFVIAIPASCVRGVEGLHETSGAAPPLASCLADVSPAATQPARVVVLDAVNGISRYSVAHVAGVVQVAASAIHSLPLLLASCARVRGIVDMPNRPALALLLDVDSLSPQPI